MRADYEFLEYSVNVGKIAINDEHRSRARVAVMLDYHRKLDGLQRPPNSRRPRSMKTHMTRFRLQPLQRQVRDDTHTDHFTHNEGSQVPRTSTLVASHLSCIDTSRPATRALLHYYMNSYWTNSAAVNPSGAWTRMALTDPAMTHATLSLVALHRSDRHGSGVSVEHFYHRGQAIRILADRIVTSKHVLNDSSLGAMALLTSLDDHFQWPQSPADAHITVLSSLVANLGGIDTPRVGDALRRVLGWVDLLHSAMDESEPRLDKSQMANAITPGMIRAIMGHPPSTEDCITPESPAKANLSGGGTSIRRMSIMKPLSELVDLLALLTQFRKNIPSPSPEQRALFSNALWSLEYDLICLPASRIDHLIWGDPRALRAFRDATLIHSYSELRIQNSLRIYGKFTRRLHRYIEPVAANLRASKLRPQLDDIWLLLWTLQMGWRSAILAHHDGHWFLARAAEIVVSYSLHARFHSPPTSERGGEGGEDHPFVDSVKTWMAASTPYWVPTRHDEHTRPVRAHQVES